MPSLCDEFSRRNNHITLPVASSRIALNFAKDTDCLPTMVVVGCSQFWGACPEVGAWRARSAFKLSDASRKSRDGAISEMFHKYHLNQHLQEL